MKTRRLLLIPALLLSLFFLIGADAPVWTEEPVRGDGDLWSCRFDGVAHSFLLDLPETPAGSPLLLMLHGYAQTGASFRSATALAEQAVREGYTVAFVTGAPAPGDKTSATGWESGVGAPGNRDVDFLRALAAYLQREFGCDAERCFAAGFSNGAFMAHRLALEAGDSFSAVVSVAGTVAARVWEQRPDTLHVGLLQITGEKDAVIPRHSDGSARYSPMPAVEDVIAYYAQANALENTESRSVGKGSVLTVHTGEASDRQVWHLLVKNGRHSWSAEAITGIDTNRLVLDFLNTQ